MLTTDTYRAFGTIPLLIDCKKDTFFVINSDLLLRRADLSEVRVQRSSDKYKLQRCMGLLVYCNAPDRWYNRC